LQLFNTLLNTSLLLDTLLPSEQTNIILWNQVYSWKFGC
jgi:hypothetical protein